MGPLSFSVLELTTFEDHLFRKVLTGLIRDVSAPKRCLAYPSRSRKSSTKRHRNEPPGDEKLEFKVFTKFVLRHKRTVGTLPESPSTKTFTFLTRVLNCQEIPRSIRLTTSVDLLHTAFGFSLSLHRHPPRKTRKRER